MGRGFRGGKEGVGLFEEGENEVILMLGVVGEKGWGRGGLRLG